MLKLPGKSLLLFLTFLYSSAWGQTLELATKPLNTLLFQSAELFVSTPINAKIKLGIGLEYKPRMKKSGEMNNYYLFIGDYFNHAVPFYRMYALGANFEYQFNDQSSFYTEILRRNWNFERLEVSGSSGDYRFEGLRSQNVNVWLWRLGWKVRLTNKSKVFVDFLGGIDLRHKHMVYQTFNGLIQDRSVSWFFFSDAPRLREVGYLKEEKRMAILSPFWQFRVGYRFGRR
ncbi:MAG: hypothetical protein ACPF8V_12240 [Luteibaculum sp.]